jgi:hypothetical protein
MTAQLNSNSPASDLYDRVTLHLSEGLATGPSGTLATTQVSFVMKNSLYAALAALALVAGVPLAASAADPAAIPFDGPRPSSLNNWPGMTGSTVPPDGPAASAVDGPRPSSAH